MMPPRRPRTSAPPPAPPPPAPGADLEATARAAALAQALIGAGWLDDGRAASLYRTVVGQPPSSEWEGRGWMVLQRVVFVCGGAQDEID